MSVLEANKEEHVSKDEIEIRLSDIIQFIKDSRRSVLLWSIVFILIGVLYALSKGNEYTATVRVMPELKGASGTGGLNDLKSLAGLAGVNLDNPTTTDAIRPDLYPDIVQSIPFTLFLLGQPVTTSERAKPYTLQEFFEDRSKNSFLGNLMGGTKEEKSSASVNKPKGPTLRLTKQQEGLSKELNQRVSAAIDKKTGIITITSQMPDATVAAIIAQQTLNHLSSYVTNYRTEKARQQVQFLNQQVNNARQRYQATEYALSSYRDQNRSLFLNTAKIEEQRLQADFLLAQSVYNDLSKQLEQARIKVQEDAPVFQVLEPARVPINKSGPNRTAVVIGFAVFGAMLGFVIQLIRRLIKR
jgi:uncharacterized protein involved in exopolysaccharide biosynthesis